MKFKMNLCPFKSVIDMDIKLGTCESLVEEWRMTVQRADQAHGAGYFDFAASQLESSTSRLEPNDTPVFFRYHRYKLFRQGEWAFEMV